jgi:hypothetical protein
LNETITNALLDYASSAKGSGTVRKHCNSIPVKKANGEELIVYEVWGEPRLFGLIADYRLELSTGETIELVDENTFVIVRTGERLTRVKYTRERG